VADQELAAATAGWQPLLQDFRRAHDKLVDALDRRANHGELIDTADVLALYDARTVASHAQGPAKARVREVERWRKLLLHQIKALNARVGK
jgi:hypothetical protein